MNKRRERDPFHAKRDSKSANLYQRPNTSQGINRRKIETPNPVARKQKSEILDEKKDDKDKAAPKNVNEFLHILGDQVGSTYLNWTLGLRSQEPKIRQSHQGPPSFFYQDAKSGKEKGPKKVTDIKYTGNTLEILHLIKHRPGPTATLSQVSFETGLRNYKGRTKQIHARNFDSTPIKQKSQDIPKFLPPIRDAGVRLLKKLPYCRTEPTKGETNKIIKISAFEGAEAFPRYDTKIQDKNCNVARHLMKPNKKMSTVKWEANLRSYSQGRSPVKF